MSFPWVHVAGDTLDFEVSVPDYPATDGWTLKYYLTPRFAAPVQATIEITASGNADGTYQVQAGPATTSGWAVGAYGWSRLVEKAGARQTLTGSADQGEVQVRQNPATAAQGFDSRSHARRTLEAIEAVIEGRATRDQEEYTIGTRSLKRTPVAELLVLRDRYRREAASEDAAAQMSGGASNPRLVGVRFNNP